MVTFLEIALSVIAVEILLILAVAGWKGLR